MVQLSETQNSSFCYVPSASIFVFIVFKAHNASVAWHQLFSSEAKRSDSKEAEHAVVCCADQCWPMVQSMLCQSYFNCFLQSIKNMVAQCYCQAPVCIQVSYSSASEQNLHLCCFLQSTVNIPSTLHR